MTVIVTILTIVFSLLGLWVIMNYIGDMYEKSKSERELLECRKSDWYDSLEVGEYVPIIIEALRKYNSARRYNVLEGNETEPSFKDVILTKDKRFSIESSLGKPIGEKHLTKSASSVEPMNVVLVEKGWKFMVAGGRYWYTDEGTIKLNLKESDKVLECMSEIVNNWDSVLEEVERLQGEKVKKIIIESEEGI